MSFKFNYVTFFVAYLYGVLFGFIIWNYFICGLPFIPHLDIKFSIAALNVLGFASAAFLSFRCITMLSLLGFFDKMGRTFIKALIVMMLLNGPVQNILANSKEVVYVFVCSTTFTYNLTMAKIDLIRKPFQASLVELNQNLPHLINEIYSIRDIIDNLNEETEFGNKTISKSEDDSIKFQNTFKEKVHERCKSELKNAEDVCDNSVIKSYEKCMDMLPAVINRVLCWPIKVTSFCFIAEVSYKLVTNHLKA